MGRYYSTLELTLSGRQGSALFQVFRQKAGKPGAGIF
jgi:hypothetical protein